MDQNRKAFLDMIAVSEIGKPLLAASDNGYNVIVGGALFQGYDDHPRKLVYLPKLRQNSSAAGRYQILARYYDAYKKQLGLKDFSPDSQTAIAMQMIKECRALNDIDAGRFASAVAKCASRWASFPGATYGQHTNKIEALQAAYKAAGGVLA